MGLAVGSGEEAEWSSYSELLRLRRLGCGGKVAPTPTDHFWISDWMNHCLDIRLGLKNSYETQIIMPWRERPVVACDGTH
jgi:hypothetical protein